jgi:uncharacterized protein YjaG (DUF416 family)
MNYQDFTRIIETQISLLPQKRRLELALKICKELFFEYQKFSETYNWGDPDLLLDGILLGEKALSGELDSSKIVELISKIDSVIPDTEDFGSTLGSYALNASISVFETLEFLIDNDKDHIINIASYYINTAAFKTEEECELTMEEIDKHPLMNKATQFLITETKRRRTACNRAWLLNIFFKK